MQEHGTYQSLFGDTGSVQLAIPWTLGTTSMFLFIGGLFVVAILGGAIWALVWGRRRR